MDTTHHSPRGGPQLYPLVRRQHTSLRSQSEPCLRPEMRYHLRVTYV